jgi:glyoxylase-like metal-dependent hydrolase (beta-lactamase superfamily II)
LIAWWTTARDNVYGVHMLVQVVEGVWVHESGFIQSNAVVVRGRSGVLIIDPGITDSELKQLSVDVRGVGPVIAGFSTHPDWDHALWHPALGDAPRYATARGAAAMRAFVDEPGWRDRLSDVLPPEHADEIPTELLGLLTGLTEGAAELPWDGPRARILEHRGHAEGHAALVFEERGLLVAGDMVSDILIPFLDLESADPAGEYLAGLDLLESVADGVDVVVPGHGSVGDRAALRARIELDRRYVERLRDGADIEDPRVGPDAPLDWIADVHEWQAKSYAERA